MGLWLEKDYIFKHIISLPSSSSTAYVGPIDLILLKFLKGIMDYESFFLAQRMLWTPKAGRIKG